MIKAIIIDDEPLACTLLQEMLQSEKDIQVIAVCYDGFEGLKNIQELQPELIFLDIQMPKITGIEMLELLPDPPQVIFTTAYDEYAIKAFEINAIDYLLKPYSADRLHQAVSRIREKTLEQAPAPGNPYAGITTAESASRVVVKDGNTIKIIALEDIYYIEAASDYVKVTTKDKYYLKHGTMQHFEDILPAQQFIRAHRSFLVNTMHIHKLELYEKGSHCIVLRNNAVVPVSKSGYSRLKVFLG